MRRIVMWQHSPLAACLYDIQHCLYQWSLMIFAFISGWKEFFDCFPLFVCQITFVICCLIFFFHISYYTTFLLWTQALNHTLHISHGNRITFEEKTIKKPPPCWTDPKKLDKDSKENLCKATKRNLSRFCYAASCLNSTGDRPFSLSLMRLLLYHSMYSWSSSMKCSTEWNSCK